MEQEVEDVFSYIKNEENEFRTHGVPVIDGWDFFMFNHIRLTVLYKYGQLDTGKTDDKPVENIILPILNVAYRLEDIEVKDIVPYVDNEKDNYKSFFSKKYHDRWARKNEVDKFIDHVKTEWIDFGLGLVKFNKSPEYVPLQRLAFCDQTDILSGPICEKHQFSIDQLLEMKGRWDEDAIDEAISLSRAEKMQQQVRTEKSKTPGKYVEVYELHGMFPESWNPKVSNPNPEKYTRQIHVVTYCRTKDNNDKGIALYQGSEKEQIYDAVKRDDIYGRACGLGGGEELFEPQVWHTYSRIQMKEMLDVASAIIVKTNDSGLAKRQRITDLEKGEIMEVEDGKDVNQLVITPINWQVFDKWQSDMKLAAQTQGSANDPQLGVEPKSGTAMGLQRTVIAQGQGIHQYRRGIFADFIERLYRKWFLRQMVDEMNKGDKWMEELDLDDMKWLADKITKNEIEKRKKRLILEGRAPSELEIEDYKEVFRKQWMEKGNKRFISILKDEFKDISIDVKINVAGKQKDLGAEADKIFGFIKMIISTKGEILNIPGMDKLLNQVIEYVGLNPVDFSTIGMKQPQPAQELSPQAIQAPVRPQLAPTG